MDSQKLIEFKGELEAIAIYGNETITQKEFKDFIVHRDLKPQNILLDACPYCKAIAEEIIEDCFVKGYRILCNDNRKIIETFLEKIFIGNVDVIVAMKL